MRRGVLLACLCGMAMAVSSAAEPKPGDDLSALQGNWKLLQCECEGKAQMRADDMKALTATYDKTDFYLYYTDLDKDGKTRVMKIAHASVGLDPTTNPRGITFELAEGVKKGARQHGIYEIAGNQLKLCYGQVTKARPTEFKSAPGSGLILETWVRTK